MDAHKQPARCQIGFVHPAEELGVEVARKCVESAAYVKQLRILARMMGKTSEKDAVSSLREEEPAYPQRLLLGPPAPIAASDVGYHDVDLAAHQSILGAQNCHLGQLKLFYTLLEFLTVCVTRGISLMDSLVVYIGAAPGTNIIAVSELFPDATFLLYDPAPFDSRLMAAAATAGARVHVRTGQRDGMFSLATCPEIEATQKRLKKKHLLFISDIRLNPTEEEVMRDMLLQQSTVLTLRPLAYQLKFRLPYYGAGMPTHVLEHLIKEYAMERHKTLLRVPKGAGDAVAWVGGGGRRDSSSAKRSDVVLHGEGGQAMIKRWWYLGGDVYTQLYPPVRSTETRLVGFRSTLDGRVTAAGKYDVAAYDVLAYENALNAFNLAVRALKQYPRAPLVAEFVANPLWRGWKPTYEAVCELAIWDAYHAWRDPTAHAEMTPAKRAERVRAVMFRMHDIMGITPARRESCKRATAERHAMKHAKRTNR